MSKQPVMEALRLLSADGIVEILPQVGCQVATYSPVEVVDFFTMFGGFEGAIAAAAAIRRTDAQLAEMAAGVAAFERLGEIIGDSYRSRRYFQLNHEFHSQIHRMSGSRIMSTTSRRMWDMCDFLINTTGPTEPMAHSTQSRHAQHEAIRAALIAGDADAAGAAMQHHIVTTVDLILAREG
jgi:DNA-binding GntR family transcriptional regulator